MKIGTPPWWSPPQPPAGSKVPRPATTAPVDMNSSTIRRLAPVRWSAISLWSASALGRAHSCRRCPPSPSPLSSRSFGPAMKPSRDIDMYRTVADTSSPFAHQGSRSRIERLGDERVRAPVGLGGHPREDDRADALCRLADRGAELAQARVGRLEISGHVLDDEARVAARLDLVEPEAARVLEPRQQRAVLGDVGPGDADRLAVGGEHGAVCGDELEADRRRAGIAAGSAVGRQDRIAAPGRARRWSGPPAARLGERTSLGVAAGTAATAGRSAPLWSCHGYDTTPRRRYQPPGSDPGLSARVVSD